jgi:hypothetical protein
VDLLQSGLLGAVESENHCESGRTKRWNEG